METPLGCSSAADARQQGGWIRPKTGLGIWGLGFGVWGFSVTRERSALRTQHHPASRLWGGGACQADCSCVKCDRPAEMRWRCEGPTMQRTQGPLAKPTQTNALWGLALRWAPNSQAMVPAIPHCGAYAVLSLGGDSVMRAVGVRTELGSKIEVGSRGKRFVSGFLANGAQRMLLGMQIVALHPEPFVFNRFRLRPGCRWNLGFGVLHLGPQGCPSESDCCSTPQTVRF